jgi:hypothetical protein
MFDKINLCYRNSLGHWWLKDDVCCHDDCDTLIDDCDNEYSYHGRGQRILRCRYHYYLTHDQRREKEARHPVSGERIGNWKSNKAHALGGVRGEKGWKGFLKLAQEIWEQEVTYLTNYNLVPIGRVKAPEYNYPEFPDEIKKEFEEKTLKQKPNGTQDTRGWVYLLANPAWTHLKIGTALDLKKRLSQYQTGAPDRDYKYLHISTQFYDDSYKAEKDIHNALGLYRIKGTEWFDINEEQGTKAIEDYGLRSRQHRRIPDTQVRDS